MIRLLVIATALLYGQALIVCAVPEGEVLAGAEPLSESAETDSVPFHNAETDALPVIIAALDAEACYSQKFYRP